MFSKSGNITTEKINWQSTLIGAVSLVGAQIVLRLFSIVPVIGWILLTGRGAGVLLLTAAWIVALRIRVRRFWPLRITLSARSLKKYEARKALVLLGLGLVLILGWASGYWPAVSWEIGGGRLWLAHPWGSLALSPFWLWVRLAVITVLPWAVIRPGANLDWVLDIETRWPKARETGFTQADIESPGARGPRGTGRIRRPAARNDLTMTLGDIQIPNPPDADLVMKVDGV